MKNLVILLVVLACSVQVQAQASWSTRFSFILYNEINEKIDLKTFCEEYQLADVMGRIIPEKELKHHLTYDDETGYFILDITTIGPRFSFALYHNNTCMAIYLPFEHTNVYYAAEFKFRKGKYLFDFNIEDKEKLYLKSNMPSYKIEKINWRKQQSHFEKSDYSLMQVYRTSLD